VALPHWQYLHGEPQQHGIIKAQESDFCVTEELGYETDGQGEHLFIVVEKRGLNTVAVAKMIAIWANVLVRDVSYAGLKDRYGITRQTFSVQLPGKESAALTLLETDQLKVLSATRNSKKLRRGALKGNRFNLLIRDVENDDAIESRLRQIASQGVPNYFGLQRFGHDGQNIDCAIELFGGKKVKNRDKRSIYLSAARSLVFNQVVSARIAKGLHLAPINGDAFMLSGSKAGFTPETVDDEILSRFAAQDIILSAPMVGKGSKVHDLAAAFEAEITEPYQGLVDGLIKHGLKHERRGLLLLPTNMCWCFNEHGLQLSFSLPAGSYATSVMREIANISDASRYIAKKEDK